MKKRLCTALLVIACVFGLVACGSSDGASSDKTISLTQEQQEQWYDAAAQAVESIDEAVRDGTSASLEDDSVYGPAVDSWENALTDIGEIQSIEGESVSFTKDDGTVTVLAHGSKHDAEVVFSLEAGKTADGSSTYNAVGITTNVIYSMAEKMQQAGLNTLLGMGTTFVVLILLALIIAVFGKILTVFNDRRRFVRTNEAAPEPAPAPKAAAAEPAAELTDDRELVAVIAAAVAAYEGRQTTDGFVVRSIRKSRKR